MRVIGTKYQVGSSVGDITIKTITDTQFEVSCVCGRDRWIRKDSFSKISKTCSCPKHEKLEAGQKHGKLTLVKKSVDNKSFSRWECKCECGKTTDVGASQIVSGVVVSCGCSRRHIKKDIEAEILAKYKSGITCTDLAKEYGIKDHTIRRMMDRHGMDRRSNADSVRRIHLDETSFEVLTRDSMYWMGFIGADGNVHGRNLKIELHPVDETHLVKFKQFCKTGHEVKRTKKGKYVAITFSSQRVVGSLAKFNITPNKSLTFDPYPYCANNADFWRGMIDGDGSVRICKDGYLKIMLCGSKPCIEAFSKWVQANSCSRGTIHKDENIYKVQMSGQPAREIAAKLYGNNPRYYLERKAKVAEKVLGIKLPTYAL